jgi:hypothetical protein
MTRRRRIAGLAALTALALSACASGDAKVSEVRDAVREAGATGGQADCVEEQFDREFSQDQLNDIGAAEEFDQIEPASLAEQVRAILDECVGSGSSSTTEEGGEGEPSESDESTTTTESGDTTSTTAAG